MPDTPTPSITDEERRRILGLVLAGSACAGLGSAPAVAQDDTACSSIRNSLLWAMAYKQTARHNRLTHRIEKVETTPPNRT